MSRAAARRIELITKVLSRYTPDEQATLFRFFAEATPAFHEASDQLRVRRER